MLSTKTGEQLYRDVLRRLRVSKVAMLSCMVRDCGAWFATCAK